mmetsp:Transcript_52535/g.86979  ORF Transcript_52535/g.86979 Transcript_52535/m.86979 type:complete len:182 (+) Transcript_52535:2-547(+)
MPGNAMQSQSHLQQYVPIMLTHNQFVSPQLVYASPQLVYAASPSGQPMPAALPASYSDPPHLAMPVAATAAPQQASNNALFPQRVRQSSQPTHQPPQAPPSRRPSRARPPPPRVSHINPMIASRQVPPHRPPVPLRASLVQTQPEVEAYLGAKRQNLHNNNHQYSTSAAHVYYNGNGNYPK